MIESLIFHDSITYLGFLPNTMILVLSMLIFKKEVVQNGCRELIDSCRSCGLSENKTMSSAKSRQDKLWLSMVYINNIYIYIYNVFQRITTTMNLCYNLYCAKKMANFEHRQLEIGLEFVY